MKNLILILTILSVTFSAGAQSPSQEINALEYFIDLDPGAGSGTPLAVTSGSSIDETFGIILPSLSSGFHKLYIRARDNNHSWSLTQRSEFYIPAPLPENIVALQYFFDIDPGIGVVGNGGIIPITPTSTLDESFVIPIHENLTAGYHNLLIRTQNEFGVWSLTQRSEFYIPAPLPENIVALQYYFDTDPGVGIPGNGGIIPVTPNSVVDQNFAIPIPANLSNGYHFLYLRTQNEFGAWSISEKKPLALGECVDVNEDYVVAWWPFDEASEAGVSEISGDYDGVLLNGASTKLYTDFDGIDDYIGVPDNDVWAFGAEDFSIEFMASFSNPGGDIAHPQDKFIGQSEGAGDTKKWTFALGGGQLFFRLSDGSSSQNLAMYPFVPVLHQWYHIALTRNADTLRTYIDGQLAGYQVVPGLSIPNVNSALTIGWVEWVQGGSPGFMEGKLDEMTIYNHELTQEDIMAIANAGAGGKCKHVRITTDAISDGLLENEFSQTLQAELGTAPYTWAVTGGTLPDGIMLSAEGVLNGTPELAGDFPFTVQVTDANNDTSQKNFVIAVELTTLPYDYDFRVFKSGTSAVPGREMDYFILIKNEGDSENTFYLNEHLQIWFHYINSIPSANIEFTVPNYYTEDTSDIQPGVISWEQTLIPDESSLLTYKVKLDPTFPPGHIVRGPVCAEGYSPLCSMNANEWDAFIACQQADYYECMDMENIALRCKEKGLIDPNYTTDPEAREKWEDCIKEEREECGTAQQNCQRPQKECVCVEDWTDVPLDPNEKLVLADLYIRPQQELPYVVHFENIGTIEALDVFIKDTLDENLDETTLNIISSAGASFDTATRVIKWDLYNYNLQPDSSGYVIYTVKPKPNLPSGTIIHNTAQIQFEVFDVFSTNETENIIDYTDPEGLMDALPAITYQTAFPITWSGMDAVGEIRNYSIFVSTNGGGYELFLSKTKDTSAIFTGETGNSYSFICIAEDLAGNVEVQDPIAEATTQLEVLCTDVFYYDADNDGFGDVDYPSMSCTQPQGFAINSTDCNDHNAAINPGATELCNFIDDDCDGFIDEGVTTTFYLDSDEDGFGDPASYLITCEQPLDFVGNGNDCDDTNESIHPDATEIADGVDNDCDGLIDESLSDLSIDAGDCASVYLGYDPEECTDLIVAVEGGTAPYTYLWSNGATTSSITVCPEETTIFTITVTDNNGFSAQDVVTVHVINIRCGNNNDKVLVCHVVTENNLCVSSSSVQDHLDHGDYLGICNAADPCAPPAQYMVNGKPNENTETPDHTVQMHNRTIDVGENFFSIRPNPANDQFEIWIKSVPCVLSLIDVSGKIILQQVLTSEKNIIPTGQLMNGIYFIRIKNGSECQTESIVILH